MRCDEVQSELLLGAPSELRAELAEHVRECQACQRIAVTQRSLDAVLALDAAHRPGPGFDTRFFARLEEERAASHKKRALFSVRMWLWALVPVAAGIALLVARPGQQPKGSAAPPEAHAPPMLIDAVAEPEDLALLEDLELIEDLDVVQRLEELEDSELLLAIDSAELERLAAEESAP